MANSIESDNTTSLNVDENYINFRRRKNYTSCAQSQKTRFKNLIRLHLDHLTQFCNSIGLKINEIILSDNNYNNNQMERVKKTVVENEMPKEFIIFKCFTAKDLTNLSSRKYSLMKSTLKEIITLRMPGIKAVTKLQFKLNNFFEIQSNDNGFFVDPQNKIKYVCQKFLKRNPDFSGTKFRIKLSADSTSISRTHINVLNFTFNLLDDEVNSTSVFGEMILGNYIQNEQRCR